MAGRERKSQQRHADRSGETSLLWLVRGLFAYSVQLRSIWLDNAQSRPVARGLCAVALACFLVNVLTSCNSATVGPAAPSDIDVLDKVRSLDILPRQSQGVSNAPSNVGERARTAVYQGTEISDLPDARTQPVPGGDGYNLNFENSPVATVAKVILGDILNIGYTIDPRVQGTVSLVSVRPVSKTDIVFVLESALRLSGVVLVSDSVGYRLAPLGDAIGTGRVDSTAANPEPGYGISVVPLRYVSAQTILKLMDSFATKPGSVRADSTRNLLLIQGTGAERRNAVDTVQSFDVDWMRGQSVGIFPVSSGAPEPIIAELEKIMDSGEAGLSRDVLKFQSISRLNAILVVSRKPALLKAAATWISRLDHADTARSSVHVYRVRYGDARQMAKTLTAMFVGGSQGSLDSADNQLARGSGSIAVSSGDRLSPNSNSSAQFSGFGPRVQSGGAGGTSAAGTAGGGTLGSPQTTGESQPNAGSLDSNGVGSGAGQPLLKGVRITADADNKLLIYADQANFRIIEATLKQIDQPPLQVGIDATIAEVRLTNQLSYGVQFYLAKQGVGSLLNTQATSPPISSSAGSSMVDAAASALINRVFPGFNFLLGSESNPHAILDALHQVTSVKVLSNPSLVVVNNQVATLQVGDVVPVSTGSATVLTTSNTVVNTIDYRNTGIILRVSPRISDNGTVRLDVEQEISNVTPTTTTSLTPTVSQRRVKSSISVENGQTVLLAGLISEEQDGNRSGIPLLDEIKGLGDAFSHQNKTGTRTELIIFIRPQIIRDGADAQRVAEELRSKLRGSVGASTDDLVFHSGR
ncbi:type II secretion system secretin GspD [Bradyrhizobium sp. KB893862 SZCCT0404]|uniref:type II secretion system secretin GspD n=1 Tax=Bradyrhizobium sp. KB893862 SZCCT0404 TaxID=2807672 RepID=UPI001BA4EDFF|nr:type II secretion system secretin GspD [Bradyrhizobium sp. KB893862 SZCCT0404]MBR1175266.1 type II secretion system secretin GspD [Bradyrhizobium sp. KB893862 SZCCT0404]